MELVMLVVCVGLAWVVAITLNSLPGLGSWLIPSPWLLGGVALVAATWLMRD